jgi:hypothetical protein
MVPPMAAAMTPMMSIVRRRSIRSRRLAMMDCGRQRWLLRIGLKCRSRKNRRYCESCETQNTFHGISPRNQKSPVQALKHKNKKKSREIINARPVNNPNAGRNDERGCQAH